MNLPNKLTIFRIILIPFFVIFFMLGTNNYNGIITFLNYQISIYRVIAGFIFIIASLTDTLDGIIARKYNLITNFGKFMDPLADKMLVLTAFILLIYTKEVNVVFVIIIVLREILISAIRLIAVENGIVIQASKLGKIKTTLQMVAAIFILFCFYKINSKFYMFTYSIFNLSELFVILSFIDYCIINRTVLKKGLSE